MDFLRRPAPEMAEEGEKWKPSSEVVLASPDLPVSKPG
jgi:hypothetical protein